MAMAACRGNDCASSRLVIVTLNLRGTRFDIPQDYADLLPGSAFLQRVLRGAADLPLDAVGAKYVSRNPTHFNTVLDMAADPNYEPHLGQEWEQIALGRELAFWGVRMPVPAHSHGHERPPTPPQPNRIQPQPR